MLGYVIVIKKDILSLIHAFIRRRAIVKRRYFLISKISEDVKAQVNDGMIELMTSERDFLRDLL